MSVRTFLSLWRVVNDMAMNFNREPPLKWLVDVNHYLHDVHQRVPIQKTYPYLESPCPLKNGVIALNNGVMGLFLKGSWRLPCTSCWTPRRQF